VHFRFVISGQFSVAGQWSVSAVSFWTFRSVTVPSDLWSVSVRGRYSNLDTGHWSV